MKKIQYKKILLYSPIALFFFLFVITENDFTDYDFTTSDTCQCIKQDFIRLLNLQLCDNSYNGFNFDRYCPLISYSIAVAFILYFLFVLFIEEPEGGGVIFIILALSAVSSYTIHFWDDIAELSSALFQYISE